MTPPFPTRSESASADSLVVATLNIRNRADRWHERASLLIEQLVELQPDIIGLQEIRRPGGQGNWILREVNRRLPPEAPLYTAHYAWKTGLRRYWEGLAIVTRLPIVDSARFDLGGGSRVAQRVRVGLPDGGWLAFYNTHLHHAAEDDVLRREQAERIADWIERSPDEFVVLVGDFNSEPETDVVQLLTDRFQSAYRIAHGTEPDLTAPTPLNATEAARFSTIDYIFVDPRLDVQHGWLTFTSAAADDERLYASDHFGIAARIVVPSR
ncbi:MAG TPA: endonuclease/exonuclease/phosphatase family protein [Thermomicrobiales bacterium]|nr:endonuclease/exonuclease/phosphatase family protein [Thermomicrobiales bacterium]